MGRLTVAPGRQGTGIGTLRREPVHERLVLVHLEKELRG